MLSSGAAFVETHIGRESHKTEAVRLSLHNKDSKLHMNRKSAFVVLSH